MPSLDWNRKWDRYEWPEHGDEWSGQAHWCGQSYEAWKDSVFETFIRGNLAPSGVSLEVGCGHGRWSEYLVRVSSRVILVDLNPTCVVYCRERFAPLGSVCVFANDGDSLPFVEDASVDFIWSWDSFVHMEPDVIRSYLREFARVLRPGGRAIVHHAGRLHATLPLAFVAGWGRPGKWVYRVLSMRGRTGGGGDGDRGMVSRRTMRRAVMDADLALLFQVDRWGERGRFDCRRFRDAVTGMAKPESEKGAGARD